MSTQDELAQIVGQRIEETKEHLKQQRVGYNDILNGRYKFQVTLISLWFNDGEKAVIEASGSELRQTIKKAEDDFKKRFNRSDVQADCKITVITESGYHFVIDSTNRQGMHS